MNKLNMIDELKGVPAQGERKSVQPTSVRPVGPPWVILREVVTCPLCQAYKDGYAKAGADGFCDACGTHMSLIKKVRRNRTALTGSKMWGWRQDE